MLVAMAMATTVTAVATRMMSTTTTRILRTLHRRNYGKTIIATTTLSKAEISCAASSASAWMVARTA